MNPLVLLATMAAVGVQPERPRRWQPGQFGRKEPKRPTTPKGYRKRKNQMRGICGWRRDAHAPASGSHYLQLK